MGMLATYLLDSANRSRAQDYASQQYGADSPQAAFANAFPEQFAATEAQKYQKQAEGNAIAQFYGGGLQSQPQAQGAPEIPQGQPMDLDSALSQMGQQTHQQTPDNSARYQAMAYLPSSLQTIAAQQMMFEGQGMGGNSAGTLPGDTPEERIANLQKTNPAIGATVKSMVEGRMAPPSSFALKTPYWQQAMQIANQVDPNFDQTLWQQRSKTVQDVISPSGKSRQNINSIETAINHLSQLQDANKELGGWGALNQFVRNPIMSATNDPRLGQYTTIAKTSADEVAKATAGPGGSTVGDRDERFKQFSADQSPEVRQKNIETAVHLLLGRLEPVASSYNAAMGKAIDPVELLSPTTQTAYKKITGTLPDFTNQQGGYQQQPRGSAIQQTASPLGHLSDDQLLQLAKQKGLK